MSALDDTRQFWIFTCPNGHAVGVLTQDNYDREGAFWEMYGNIQKAAAAMDRGIEAELIDAPEYHATYAGKMSQGCTCRG